MLLVVIEGMTYKQAAARLGIEVSTVRSHMTLAYKRLGVSNAQQAAVKVIRNGWDEEDADIRQLTSSERDYLARMDQDRSWTSGDGYERLLADIAQGLPSKPDPRASAAEDLARVVPRVRL